MTEMQESAELKNQVLALVADRLSSGEVLISRLSSSRVKAQFQLKQITGSGECVSPSSRSV